MELEYSLPPVFIWPVRIISFVILILTIYAIVNIFQSIWFRFLGSRQMDDRAKREYYVRKKHDVKWSLSLTLSTMLSSINFLMMKLSWLSGLVLFISLLFWFLWWGNSRTLDIETKRLERKKEFGT